jgi:hypothetical protein
MRIHTGVGTTPTILVIVVTIGDVRRLGAREPSAALRADLARAACADLTGIPATTGAPELRENATGAVRLSAPRLWACRVGVAALGRLGMDARVRAGGVTGALPGAADGAARGIERVAPAVPAA